MVSMTKKEKEIALWVNRQMTNSWREKGTAHVDGIKNDKKLRMRVCRYDNMTDRLHRE